MSHSKKRPKWSKNVKQFMVKKCKYINNCTHHYKGIIKDTQGNILRTISCENNCPLKNK